MGYLFKLQKEVQNFAEAISAALKIETEILDDDFFVVGATSHFLQEFLLQNTFSNIHVTRHVIESKRPMVLLDPSQNQLCTSCLEKEECFYKAGLYYPIVLNGICYGVISLVAFNEEQKKIIADNSYPFMNFTSIMANLLASKIQESIALEELYKTNEYLNTIISSVHEGIIACDAESQITCFNRTAEEKLGVDKAAVIGRSVLEIFPDSQLAKAIKNKMSIYDTNVQYSNINGEPVHVVSNVTLVKKEASVLGAVESFNTEENLYRFAHRLLFKDYSCSFNNIIGNSAIMQSVKSRASTIAKSPSTVLITGESGTGKELFANAIHKSSHRSEKPFIAINCGAIPDSLLESELFGYEKGAFTGARVEGKPGIFELAQGGTIFLDEIGDMPLNLQVKLLRVLQEKTILRVGGTKKIAIDARIIAATNQDLEVKIAENQFREDLFYRLNVIPIAIPPLRERIEDIPLLIDFLCSKFSTMLNHNIKGVSEEALKLLCSYPWPGNIRELENAIEYAVNYSIGSEIIGLSALPRWLYQNNAEAFLSSNPSAVQTRKEHLECQERELIERELLAEGTSLEAKKIIASKLGINLSTLYRKIKKYEL